MQVTLYTIEDQLNENNYGGIGEGGYKACMDWIKKHQEYRGGERYEFGGICRADLNFVWKQTCEGLKKILNNVQDTEVFGAFHVGRLLVEFRCCGGGFDDDNHDTCNDVYVYGIDSDYGYTVHGVPYTILDYEIDIPHRRTMEGFQRACERNMIKFLNEYPEYIQYAITETVVDEWY